LAIIGTERHESRLVDRQLRGRAGRQGDPGSSQFFVSLEDDLMRMFGSDRISSIMDRLGLKEGEVIQHSMISRSIERAQKKVEENNFGIRKRLLEYDDVMNSQREVIYKRRRHALFGERLSLDISNMMYDICDNTINQYQNNAEFEEFNLEIIKQFSVETPFNDDEFKKLSSNELTEKLFNVVWDNYKRKSLGLAKQAYPVIKNVFEKQSAVYENIVVPISDGTHIYQIITNLKKAYESEASELVRSYEKTAILMTIDDAWRDHLREMDDLKQSVQNAAYEQKDPLLIYKFESFQLFRTMIENINQHLVSMLMKGHIHGVDPDNLQRAQAPKKTDLSRFNMNKSDAPSALSGRRGAQPNQEQQRVQPIRIEKKIGRNEPCPCGSGKKYKNCHGVGAE
jgi:preprotein translocase subunit SecA